MISTTEQLQVFLEIAMSIGNGFELKPMLYKSLMTYIKKLNCFSALVFKFEKEDDAPQKNNLVFSLPKNLVLQTDFPNLHQLTTTITPESFVTKPCIEGVTQRALHYYIFNLSNFGFLVLIKKMSFSNDIIYSLFDINEKLASACLACIRNEELLASEKRYRDLGELLPEMIYETDLAGNIKYANKFALDTLGYNAENIEKGLNIFDIIEPSEREDAKLDFKRILKTEYAPPFNYTLKKKDGKAISVVIYTNTIKKDNIVSGMRTVAINVTEQKNAETKLRQYTERLELALMGSDAGLWDWNILTDFVFYSERWCSMLGYSLLEVKQNKSSWEQLMHPEEKTVVRKAIEAHLKGKTPIFKVEYRLKTKNGNLKWILAQGKVTQLDTNGKALRMVGTHIDITEKKQAEELEKIELNVNLKLSKAKNLTETLKICLESVIYYSQSNSGGVYLLDEDNKGFKLVEHKNISQKDIKTAGFRSFSSPSGKLILKGEQIYSNHTQLIKQNKVKQDISLFKAVAVLPIKHYDKVIGCINIGATNQEEFPPYTKTILGKILPEIGSFIIQAQQEDILNQQRHDLNLLFSTLDDFLIILNTNGQIIYYNDIVKKRLGYPHNQLINKNFTFIHSEKHERESILWIKALVNGTEQNGLIPFQTKTGNQIPVETKTIRGTWRGTNAIITVSRDITQHISYENQLRQNTERLEMALFASGAGLWDWNIKAGNLTFNNKWLSMRGLVKDEVSPGLDAWKSLIHPDDEAIALEAVKKHLQNPSNFYQAEYRTKTKSGKYIWILDTGKVTETDEAGQPSRMVGTNIDITSKKQNELALHSNLKQQELLSEIALEINSLDSFSIRLNSILKKIGNHIHISRVYIFEDSDNGENTSNTYEWCNKGIEPQIEDLQDIPYSMIPSWKPMLQKQKHLFSKNIHELPQDLINILEPQGIKSIIVYPLYVKGLYFGFIGFDECIRIKDWNRSELELLRTVSGIISNAFERKVSEQSLKESEAKNRGILESIPDNLFHFNKDGVIINFKSSSSDDLNIPTSNFINQNIKSVFPKELHQKLFDAINICIEQDTHQFEYTLCEQNNFSDFEARMVKMSDNEVISIVRNVSERKNYERQLTKERDRANQANKAKSEFLANISHEIRTPMNAILGFSEALYHKLDAVQHKKMLKSVLNSGNMLLSLLNDILDLSKIEAGKLEMSLHPTDLRVIIEEIRLLFRDKAQKKSLEFNLNISPGFPKSLLLDEIRLKQIIFNLVGNALKFTMKGYIEIMLDFEETNVDIGELTLEVIDTGIGIPSDQQQIIFEAFRQQSMPLNKKYDGVGLGLAITKRLAEKMGGKIILESELGSGSTFTIQIPNTKIGSHSKPENIVEHKKVPTIVFEPATVLIIDDVLVNIETVEYLLAGTGLTVNAAESGEIALEILNYTQPSLILMDLRMPGMDGYQVATRIKLNTQTSSIPIISYTASVIEEHKLKEFQFFDGHIYKPINKYELITELQKHLKHKLLTTPKENEIKTNGLPELSKEVLVNMPLILSELKTSFTPLWEGVKDSLVLFKIEDFANQLYSFAINYKLNYLKTYSKTLIVLIDDFDLDALSHHLNTFPTVLKNIEKASMRV